MLQVDGSILVHQSNLDCYSCGESVCGLNIKYVCMSIVRHAMHGVGFCLQLGWHLDGTHTITLSHNRGSKGTLLRHRCCMKEEGGKDEQVEEEEQGDPQKERKVS